VALRRPARLAAALLLLALPACRITPDEIARIETENDLLREQIRVMRSECEQYRQLDLEVEPRDPSKPTTPAPPPASSPADPR
jgi:hypothetical protein